MRKKVFTFVFERERDFGEERSWRREAGQERGRKKWSDVESETQREREREREREKRARARVCGG